MLWYNISGDCMKKDDIVKIKSKDKIAVVVFPSKQKSFGPISFNSLTIVEYEDGHLGAVKDDDIELITSIEEK